jgi:hypothetical protein
MSALIQKPQRLRKSIAPIARSFAARALVGVKLEFNFVFKILEYVDCDSPEPLELLLSHAFKEVRTLVLAPNRTCSSVNLASCSRGRPRSLD